MTLVTATATSLVTVTVGQDVQSQDKPPAEGHWREGTHHQQHLSLQDFSVKRKT